MTGQELCISTSFLHDEIFLSRFQILLNLLLGGGAIRVAYLIYLRQDKTSNKDSILNRALQKVIMLTIDINTGQRKLEHITILMKEAQDKNDTELINELNKGLEELKTSINLYYSSRNETLDMYDKEISKNI